MSPSSRRTAGANASPTREPAELYGTPMIPKRISDESFLCPTASGLKLGQPSPVRVRSSHFTRRRDSAVRGLNRRFLLPAAEQRLMVHPDSSAAFGGSDTI